MKGSGWQWVCFLVIERRRQKSVIISSATKRLVIVWCNCVTLVQHLSCSAARESWCVWLFCWAGLHLVEGRSWSSYLLGHRQWLLPVRESHERRIVWRLLCSNEAICASFVGKLLRIRCILSLISLLELTLIWHLERTWLLLCIGLLTPLVEVVKALFKVLKMIVRVKKLLANASKLHLRRFLHVIVSGNIVRLLLFSICLLNLMNIVTRQERITETTWALRLLEELWAGRTVCRRCARACCESVRMSPYLCLARSFFSFFKCWGTWRIAIADVEGLVVMTRPRVAGLIVSVLIRDVPSTVHSMHLACCIFLLQRALANWYVITSGKILCGLATKCLSLAMIRIFRCCREIVIKHNKFIVLFDIGSKIEMLTKEANQLVTWPIVSNKLRLAVHIGKHDIKQ